MTGAADSLGRTTAASASPTIGNSAAQFFWRAAAGLAIGMGLLVLGGWLFGFELIKSGIPGTVAMKANTASSFVLTGSALLLLGRERSAGRWPLAIGIGCCGVVAVVALATLSEWVFGWDIRIDELLFQEPAGTAGTSDPGRMAASTALCFILASAAIALARLRDPRIFQLLSTAGSAVTVSALALAIYDIQALKGIASHTNMAVPTAATFVALWIGLFATRPGGLMTVARSRTSAGSAARVLLPSAIIVPLVIGWLCLRGQRLGLYGEVPGLALFTTLNVFAFTAVIWTTTRIIYSGELLARKVERELAAIVGSSADPILTRGPDGLVASWNAAAEQLFGYSAREMLGQRELILVPDDLRDRVRLEMRELWTGAPAQRTETVRVAKDGQRIPVSLVRFQVQSASGELIGVGTIFHDLRERKQAEAETLRLAAIVESSEDAIISGDAEGRVTSWNRSAERLFGYRAEDVIGKSTEFLWPETRHEERQAMLAIVASGSPLERPETVRVTASGLEVDVSLSIFPIRNGEGSVFGSASIYRDITQRKRDEEALEAMRVRLQTILETAPDGIIVASDEGIIESANPAALTIFGYSPGSLTGENISLLMPPPAANAHARYLQSYRAAGVHYVIGSTTEVFGRRRNGSIFPLELSVSEMWIGDARKFSGIVRDITAREEIHAALRESEERYRSLFENMREGFAYCRMVFDAEDRPVDFRYLAANDSFGRLTGLTDAQGKLVTEVIPGVKEQHPELFEIYGRVARSGIPESFEIDFKPIARWLTVSVYSVERDHFIAVFDDITERKAAEEALRDSEEKYRSLVETAQELIWKCDSEGRFTYLNPAWEQTHGYKVEEMLGKGFGELQRPEVFERDIQEFGRHMAGGSIRDYETTHIAKDGRELILLFNAVPIVDGHGNVTGTQGTAVDITERRRAEAERNQRERELFEAQKLESLGLLAGGIAHDFNNLLAAVMGNVSLSLMDTPETSPIRPYLSEIEVATQRAADLARQMLAYTGRGRVSVVRIDLNHLVAEINDLLAVTVSKKVRFLRELADEPPTLEGDATQLSQVVMNLITNAAEAIGDHAGTIRLSTGTMTANRDYLKDFRMDSADACERDYVYLEVADSGKGMDPETRARMFDPFFTTKFTGRGLGMAAVLGIVRGHHGGIRVESEPLRGTTIRMLFPPVAATAGPAATAIPVSRRFAASGRVLIADDEPSVLRVLERALAHMGFDVVTAADGAEALAVFTNEQPSIKAILMDMTMPTLGGVEALTAIRALDPSVPVVIMSGFGEEEALQQFVGGGPSGFLQKPFSFADVEELMSDVLSTVAAGK